MSTTTGHLIETAGRASPAVAEGSVQDADVKSMPVSENGLSSEPLEELGRARAAPAAARARPPHRCVGRDAALVDREGPDLIGQLVLAAMP
ncbi:hypothetical protein [Streptomyces sp. NPDC048277]|uniref:hypothetical protein n=1 Tax=Streptomyces sp. NPDC048277 TaxID=3155027 RepID=UPI0033E53C16